MVEEMVEIKEFEQINSMRVQIYQMLASFYFTELTYEQIVILSEQDYGAFVDVDPSLARGAKEIERALRHPTSTTREDLAVDYAHTFLAAGAGKDEQRAVPFESCFTSDTGLLMGPARQSVYKTMLKEGVLPDASLKVPEDHISFELEFMMHMANKSVEALKGDDISEARRCVEVQRDFLNDHLLNWIDDFCNTVDRVCRTRFYRGVAMMTNSFVKLDQDLLAECAEMLA